MDGKAMIVCVHGLQKSLFGILRENEFLPRRDHRKPLLCGSVRQGAEVEAVEYDAERIRRITKPVRQRLAP